MANITKEERARREAARVETRVEDREPEGRKARIPVGVQRMKMSAPQRKGYVRRWVNDKKDGRVNMFLEGGYTFVEDADMQIGEQNIGNENRNLGSRVSRVVGTHPDGSPMLAYLMEIKQEFYDEDQRAKAKELIEREVAIRAGSLANKIEADKRYVVEGNKI